MRIIKNLQPLILSLAIVSTGVFAFVAPALPVRAERVECADGETVEATPNQIANGNACINHGGYAHNDDGGTGPNAQAPQGSASTGNEDLSKLLKNLINVLSAAAMFVFIISFMFAGYQYLTARDNVSQVSAAKERIFTLVITFVLFVFGFGLLQWLVPGGIFN